MPEPPICDYEGSDYQASFWERGGREYEDRVEAIGLKRLLPPAGHVLLELGAGAGRNTARYGGFEHIVLLDFSLSQLQQAQTRLGTLAKYLYVAADAYRLPFVDGLFDAATIIRALHHMTDAPRVLAQVQRVLRPSGTLVLEFANKRNLKAILRYWLRRQTWNPWTMEPAEFAELNFDFHPAAVRDWLKALGFRIERTLTVSHFRWEPLKRVVPTAVLVWLDSCLQWTGAFWQLTPSVFLKASVANTQASHALADKDPLTWFRCAACGHWPLEQAHDWLRCPHCGARWGIQDGIYDFRHPVATAADVAA